MIKFHKHPTKYTSNNECSFVPAVRLDGRLVGFVRLFDHAMVESDTGIGVLAQPTTVAGAAGVSTR